MPKKPWLIESDKPSYQVLKWIGGGGFGQVFKIVACKQVRIENAEAALDEYDHMKVLRGAPHIATLHDGLEFNKKTNTLSFFMDYYRGKDLDRQVQMLLGAAERFSESQIVEIGYQIAVALELCHSMNVLHQDIKPMNILLKEPWNPMTQRDVPDLYVADFGIASQVQTLATRITGARGTPGYEAPEIREAYLAAFSQKSDVYAFGCVLHRLCTLEDPIIRDDLKPGDISGDYSIWLKSLISSMLRMKRDERPTATQVKNRLAAIAREMFTAEAETTSIRCRTCQNIFPSQKSLMKHMAKKGHNPEQTSNLAPLTDRITKNESIPPVDIGSTELKVRGIADAPPKHHYDESDREPEAPPPCVVCWKGYDSKQKLFQHLYCGNHTRSPLTVMKRLAEVDDVDGETNKRQRT
ncbi:hypothetical protein E8E12_006534 [Didymella heteroderae]|uniref:non-specific serine/threonine protein kinase n=1 Tax=Didymella heteroderae TaxID=1769908 RepID=A0A9P5C665_9PLEO|nr:hypothetical protein E8E12_006534 [Didymella heteroderae]